MTDTPTGMDYAAIAADLHRRIMTGEFPASSSLPSEHALAVEYDVPRGRIRSAMSSLARRGILISRPQSGWTVQMQVFDETRFFAQWAREQGHEPSGEIVSSIRAKADPTQARLLGIRLGEEVLSYVRVRRLDGRPVMVERSTWAPWTMPIVEAMPQDITSTTDALAEKGIHVVVGDQRLMAVAASSEDARLLEVRRSSPLLAVRRRTLTTEGVPAELGEDRYVAGLVAFAVGGASRVLRGQQ